MLVSSSALIPIPVSRFISSTKRTTGETRTSDDNATTIVVFVLYGLDGHVQGGNTIIDVFLRESGQAELLESIVGIRNQFSEENISKITQSDPLNRDEDKVGYLFE